MTPLARGLRMRTPVPFTLAVALLAPAVPSSATTSGSGLPDLRRASWSAAGPARGSRAPARPSATPASSASARSSSWPAVPSRFVVHVSGDQRFVLHVNGRRVGIGPSRGDILFWRFETFDLAPFLKPGKNLLSALVWNFGTHAPAAQITDRTGFVAQGDGDGRAGREHRRLVAVRAGAGAPAVAGGHDGAPRGPEAVHRRGPGRAARRGAVRLGLGGPAGAGRRRRALVAGGRLGAGHAARDRRGPRLPT